MATTVAAFRWLDLLESDFDKAFVELDAIIPEIDIDEVELIDFAKTKLASLSSAFSQLVHKAQTIFQNNAKLEAQVVDYRDKAINCRCQTESNDDHDPSTLSANKIARLERTCQLLEQENTILKNDLLSLQGEVYGARLASKYLDKELAGRIQQLQLLSQPKMNIQHQTRLWNQIESEIFLHRHKTVSRACRGQGQNAQQQSRAAKSSKAGESREVKLTRSEDQNLGISVTGGSENGLPILISKIHPGSVAYQNGELCAGDSLLAVNSTDLQGASLSKAVQLLSELKGEFTLLAYNSQFDEEDLHSSELQYAILSEEVGHKPNHMSLEKLHSLTSRGAESLDLTPPPAVRGDQPQSQESVRQTSNSGTMTESSNRIGHLRVASVQSLDDDQNTTFNSLE